VVGRGCRGRKKGVKEAGGDVRAGEETKGTTRCEEIGEGEAIWAVFGQTGRLG